MYSSTINRLLISDSSSTMATITQLVSFSIYFMISFILLFSTSTATNLRVKNSCSHNIHAVLLSKPTPPELSNIESGFSLRPGEAVKVSMLSQLPFILWAGTPCSTDSDGKFSCVAGDFNGSPIPKPLQTTTVANFTPVAGNDGQYMMSYFVSLVNGFNVPITVIPVGGSGKDCRATGCPMDLNKGCPKELSFMEGDECVGCYYSSDYSYYFEGSCPNAQTSAHDKSSISTCFSADYYAVSFCASDVPYSSPNSSGFETDDQETDNQESHETKKTPRLKPILKYILGVLGAVILVVSCGCTIRYFDSNGTLRFQLTSWLTWRSPNQPPAAGVQLQDFQISSQANTE